MFYLVCFDIVDNRDRRKVVKINRGYGYRVQKSVFECPGLTERQFLNLRNSLEEIIDNISDTVRLYRLCNGCIQTVEVVGIGEQPKTAAVVVF
jgi:CRISPR-associated protein Cas2